MKTALTILTIIMCGAALIYLGGGSAGVDVRRAVPWFGGFAPSWWDFAALLMIGFTIGRIVHMLRGPQTSVEAEEDEPEGTEAEDSVDEDVEEEDTGDEDDGADDHHGDGDNNEE